MDATTKLHKQHSFGDRLKWVRTNFDLSLEGFGTVIGYDKSYLSRLEGGKTANPSIELIESVCAKYGVSRAWLETGQGKPITDQKVADLVRQMDAARLVTEMGTASRALALEDETCTIQVIRLLMKELPLREKLKKGLKVLEDPSITPAAKTYWSTVFLRASLDPDDPDSGSKK